jgi:hypothetical protein
VLAFYNGRGTAEQHIKEGKYALKWTRLSCMRLKANAVRLQLHALACNLANFLRTVATPELIERWSLTSLRERLIKTGARLVRHGSYAVFQTVRRAHGEGTRVPEGARFDAPGTWTSRSGASSRPASRSSERARTAIAWKNALSYANRTGGRPSGECWLKTLTGVLNLCPGPADGAMPPASLNHATR